MVLRDKGMPGEAAAEGGAAGERRGDSGSWASGVPESREDAGDMDSALCAARSTAPGTGPMVCARSRPLAACNPPGEDQKGPLGAGGVRGVEPGLTARTAPDPGPSAAGSLDSAWDSCCFSGEFLSISSCKR